MAWQPNPYRSNFCFEWRGRYTRLWRETARRTCDRQPGKVAGVLEAQPKKKSSSLTLVLGKLCICLMHLPARYFTGKRPTDLPHVTECISKVTCLDCLRTAGMTTYYAYVGKECALICHLYRMYPAEEGDQIARRPGLGMIATDMTP